MIRYVVSLFVALSPVAFVAADLPPVPLPGMAAIVPPEPGVSKEVGWVAVEWGSGGIGRAADRQQKDANGFWAWCRAHDDGSMATVVMRKKVEGSGWRVMGILTAPNGDEWRTAVEDWVPGNTKYPGWHTDSGIGVDIWIDVGTAPPE